MESAPSSASFRLNLPPAPDWSGLSPLSEPHLSLVMSLWRELVRDPRPADRMRRVCELLVSTSIAADCAAVIRVDNSGPPRPLSGPYFRPGRGNHFHVSSRIVEWLRSERDAVLVHKRRGAYPTCAICCPLEGDQRRNEALYAEMPAQRGNEDWGALVALLAEAYQQAELVWAMREQVLQSALVEREMEMARQIQEAFVPKRMRCEGVSPGVEVAVGFEPCRWVGGDYIDVIPLPGRMMFAIADVCGKGLQAALVASSLQSLVRATADNGVGLPELMTRINRHLCKYLPEHSFVTMLCAMVDLRTGEMEYASAGHPGALVASRDGSVSMLREGQNVALGLTDTEIVTEHTYWRPGDVLLMYTDGLVEFVGEEGQPFGTNRLAETLSTLVAGRLDPDVEQVRHGLLDAAHDFLGALDFTDDCTFLVARRRPSLLPPPPR